MSDERASPVSLGPFTLGDILGGNGMAFTRVGVRESDGAEAVVCYIEAASVRPGIRRRMLEESERMSACVLEHVLFPCGCGEDDGWLWCAWPRLTGDHAGQLMRTGGLPPIYVGLELGRQIAIGLGELESAGLSHGALSPASVFVDGNAHVFLLHCPWGRILEGIEGGYLHPAWMSVLPFVAGEVAGGGGASAAGDAYSLGAFLYFLILGRPLYWADDPEALLEEIRGGNLDYQPLVEEAAVSVVEIIEELVSLDPDARPNDWPSLAARLAACSEEASALNQEAAEAEAEAASGEVVGPSLEDFGELADGSASNLEDTPYDSAAPTPIPTDAPTPRPESADDSRFAGAGGLNPHASSTEMSPIEDDKADTRELYDADMPAPASVHRARRGLASKSPEKTPAPEPPRFSMRDDFGVEEEPPSEKKPLIGKAIAAAMASKANAPADPQPSRLDTGPPMPPPFAPPAPVVSSGISTRAVLLVVMLLLVLFGAGVGMVMLMNPSKPPPPAPPPPPVVETPRAELPPKVVDPHYTATANTILALGRLVQLYNNAYKRYPTTFRDIGRPGAPPRDAWGTPLELREGFLLSAGKDKKWDTRDDIYFDPETSLIAGFTLGVDLPPELLESPSRSGIAPGSGQTQQPKK